MKKKRLLIITPINEIRGLKKLLSKYFSLTIVEDPDEKKFIKLIPDYYAVYTNPNKSKIYLGKKVLSLGKKLKIICTASTGTNHIDKVYARLNKIKIISLTKEYKTINKISSTAELAFAFTLMGVRNLPESNKSVQKDEWDYTNFIGRQMNFMNVGIIGYGRLGKIYSKFLNAFGSKIYVFDPYKKIKNSKKIIQTNLINLLKKSDIISLHVHHNDKTTNLLNKKNFKYLKKDVLLINTSRGEIVNEFDLVSFLKKNKSAKYYTDVISNEIRNRLNSPIYLFAKNNSKQVFITPHIGGMTKEAQELAYMRAANLLINER